MSKMAEKAYGDRPVTYPERPGYTEPTTSKDAADAMGAFVGSLREQVRQAIARAAEGGLTADEAAQAIGQTVLSVRPRVAELAALGEIIDTGRTRPNLSGRNAKIWKSK